MPGKGNKQKRVTVQEEKLLDLMRRENIPVELVLVLLERYYTMVCNDKILSEFYKMRVEKVKEVIGELSENCGKGKYVSKS